MTTFEELAMIGLRLAQIDAQKEGLLKRRNELWQTEEFLALLKPEQPEATETASLPERPELVKPAT